MKNRAIMIIMFFFLNVFPYIVVFVSMLYTSLDTDLGWHLKYGEYFFRNGRILRENTFSLEMPDYRWVNSSWGTDLVTYFAFHTLGFLGLSLVSAFTMTATFYFFSKAFNLTFWEQSILFPLLIYTEEPLTQVSFRGHLLSLMFIGILMFLLERWRKGNRISIFFTLPLFLLWVNFHGEFILGIALFGLWITVYLLSHRPITFKSALPLAASFLGSVGATLINPFTTSAYYETVKHFGNPLQKYIVEWLPFDTYSTLWWHLVIWVILVLFGALIYKSNRKLKFYYPMLVTVSIMLLFSFWVRRYTWPMLLLSIPFLKIIASQFAPANKKVRAIIASSFFLMLLGYDLIIKIPKLNLLSQDWNLYCRNTGCSPTSAQILTGMKDRGNTLTFYNWGGWMIWNYPEFKPTIDGRMHLWVDERGYSAFEKYYSYEQNWLDIDKSEYDTVYISQTKPLYNRLDELVKQGSWRRRYLDPYASIFQRVPLLPGKSG